MIDHSQSKAWMDELLARQRAKIESEILAQLKRHPCSTGELGWMIRWRPRTTAATRRAVLDDLVARGLVRTWREPRPRHRYGPDVEMWGLASADQADLAREPV